MSALAYFTVTTTVIFAGIHVSYAYEMSEEGKLSQYLLSKINASGYENATVGSRPVPQASMVVTVQITFSLEQIVNFDEKDQTLTTAFLKTFQWTNHHMQWDPADFGQVKFIRFPKDKVWIPDIILLNGIQSYIPATSAVEYVKVYHTGKTDYYEPVIYTSSCQMDLWHFPYDTQNCRLTWGSWGYSTDLLKLKWPDKKMYLGDFVGDQEWELQDTSVYGKQSPGMRDEMTYDFHLKRIPYFYVKMILIPTFLLALLVLTVFWIPPSRPDRTSLGMGVFAGFMLLLLLVVNIAPPSGSIKLGLYYCINIVLVVSSTVVSGVVVAMSTKEIQMTDFWRNLFVFKLGTYFKVLDQYEFLMKYGTSLNATPAELQNLQKLKPPGAKEERRFAKGYLTKSSRSLFGRSTMTAKNTGMEQRRVDPAHRMRLVGLRDWQVAAVVVDRFLFVVYLLAVGIVLIAFFPWPVLNGRKTELIGQAAKGLVKTIHSHADENR